jgi:hypothetical protein
LSLCRVRVLANMGNVRIGEGEGDPWKHEPLLKLSQDRAVLQARSMAWIGIL